MVSAHVSTDSALWAGKGSSLRGRLLRHVNAGIGIYNIVHWDWTILRAISPHYWIMFLVREGQDGWRLLGSLVLCITGVLRRANASQCAIRAAMRPDCVTSTDFIRQNGVALGGPFCRLTTSLGGCRRGGSLCGPGPLQPDLHANQHHDHGLPLHPCRLHRPRCARRAPCAAARDALYVPVLIP
jgi:hypothetical protein